MGGLSHPAVADPSAVFNFVFISARHFSGKLKKYAIPPNAANEVCDGEQVLPSLL